MIFSNLNIWVDYNDVPFGYYRGRDHRHQYTEKTTEELKKLVKTARLMSQADLASALAPMMKIEQLSTTVSGEMEKLRSSWLSLPPLAP